MKRNGDIASLFRKHAAKKAAATSSPSLALVATVAEDQPEEQERVTEEIVNPMPSSPPLPPPSPVYDINCLPHDPSERLPIQNYPINDQDAIRRAYILKGPFRPYAHELVKSLISGLMR